MSGKRSTLCAKKTRHESLDRAEIVLAGWQEGVQKQVARWEAGGRTSKMPRPAPVRAYKCPHCKGWHLTSGARYDRMQLNGKPVFEKWSHPRDAAPLDVGGEIQMHPFAANELRSSDPAELLRLLRVSLDQRAAWRIRKALERLER